MFACVRRKTQRFADRRVGAKVANARLFRDRLIAPGEAVGHSQGGFAEFAERLFRAVAIDKILHRAGRYRGYLLRLVGVVVPINTPRIQARWLLRSSSVILDCIHARQDMSSKPTIFNGAAVAEMESSSKANSIPKRAETYFDINSSCVLIKAWQ